MNDSPPPPTHLLITYTTWAALHRDAPSLAQGMYVRADVARLAQFAQVAVQVALPDGEDAQLRAEIVTVVPGQAVAMQWRPESREAVEALLRAVAAHPADPKLAESDEPELVVDDAAHEEHHASHMPVGDRESLQAQIEQMSVQEKRAAALHGRKEMRWLLVRDQNKSVHPFVVKNPAISVDEVEQIARLTSVNPEVLHTIATNRDWTRSINVARNIVKNPKTPMPDALALLERLPITEVRALAKSSSVRAAIQMAARKRVSGA